MATATVAATATADIVDTTSSLWLIWELAGAKWSAKKYHGYGYGSGYGYGYGYSYGNGYGDGYVYGYSYGYGNGRYRGYDI